jgi:hypothetical protein
VAFSSFAIMSRHLTADVDGKKRGL